jgi:hypothetical protein
MHPVSFLKVDTKSILIFVPLIVVLTGCNLFSTTPALTPTSSPGTSLQPSSTSVSTVPSPSSPTSETSSAAPSLNSGSVSIDVAGLHIQSSEGIQCPLGLGDYQNIGSGTDFPSDHLVLATDRLTYSQAEIQAMANYLGPLFQSADIVTSYLGTPPSTLLWVPGSAKTVAVGGLMTYCAGELQITNTGSAPVQISSAGIQIVQAPQPNNYQYRTIDVCTVLTDPNIPWECTSRPSTPTSCSVYHVTIHLNDSNAGTTMTQTPMAFPGPLEATCPELTINPSATVNLSLEFNSPNTPSNWIYSVVPQLTLSSSSGPNVVPLPQLASTLAFAEDSQISCYGLQSNTFVLETPYPTGLGYNHYCI